MFLLRSVSATSLGVIASRGATIGDIGGSTSLYGVVGAGGNLVDSNRAKLSSCDPVMLPSGRVSVGMFDQL